MSDAQVISQEKKEEARTKFNALYDLTLQMARFGPYLALRMSLYSIRALPWGIGSAGAESVKEGVDSGNEEGKLDVHGFSQMPGPGRFARTNTA